MDYSQIERMSSQEKLRYLATRVSSPLEDEDERHAQSLAVAERKYGDFSVIDEEIRQIGRSLNDNGGLGRMQLVAYRAKAIDRNVDMDRISGLWSGTGQWLA